MLVELQTHRLDGLIQLCCLPAENLVEVFEALALGVMCLVADIVKLEQHVEGRLRCVSGVDDRVLSEIPDGVDVDAGCCVEGRHSGI